MKIRTLKIISLFLALSCMFGLFIACTNEGKEPTVTGEPGGSTTKATTTAAVTTAPDLRLKLRFGSYNIAAGKKTNYDMTVFGKAIQKYDLDIVGLQEVDQMTQRNLNQDTMKIISETSGLPYYAYFKAIDYQGGEYGLGILSKYPIVSQDVVKLESGSLEQRLLAHVVIDVDGERIDFFNTHLTHNDDSIQQGQFRQIAGILAAYDNYVMVGDFNTTDFSDFDVFPGADKVNNAEHKVITFPSRGTSLDNIVYLTSAWEFAKPNRVVSSNSDHYMIYADATYVKKEHNN